MKLDFFSFTFFFIIIPLALSSQCNARYEINSQIELDSFQSYYGPCLTINELIIKDTSGDITDLSPLNSIKHIDTLEIKQCSNLNDLTGLSSLTFVNYLDLSILPIPSNKTFPVLDSINSLVFYFPEASYDLKIFENLSFIGKKAKYNGNGNLTGLSPFESINGFRIDIWDNQNSNTLDQLIPINIDSLQFLNLNRSENITISDIKNIVKINNLVFSSTKNIDFESINKIDQIKNLVLYESCESNDFHNGFVVTDLNSLEFLNNTGCETLSTIFPNLENISSKFKVNGNANLLELNLIDNFNPPNESQIVLPPWQMQSRIEILNNQNLENCYLEVLCNALEIYPDSIYIDNNGSNCSLSVLQEFCVSNLEDVESDSNLIKIYPNPFVADLNIKRTSSQLIRYKLIDTNGNKVLEGTSKEKLITLKMNNEPSGMYILQIHSILNNQSTYSKVIKLN